jgi:hypothetical protein
MPVTASLAVVSAGTQIASTVANIKDVNKRRDIEMAISRLSADDQRKLNQKIARVQSQNERLNILASEITKIQIEQIKEKRKKDTTTAIVIIGGSLVVLLAVFILTRTKN